LDKWENEFTSVYICEMWDSDKKAIKVIFRLVIQDASNIKLLAMHSLKSIPNGVSAHVYIWRPKLRSICILSLMQYEFEINSVKTNRC
jgi:hypothetical protein